jgi:hypothetical protein
MIRRAPAFALVTLALVADLRADTIRLADGTTVDGVQVVSEGLKEIAYKEGGKDKTLPSGNVVAIGFDKKPKEVDEAEGLISEDDLEGAIDTLDAYVATVLDKKSAGSFKWAPAYAAWRAVEVRTQVADFEGMRSAADRVLKSFPETRYVPGAYLAKATAELQSGRGADAQTTLASLWTLIETQGLDKRWQIECKLAQAEANDKLKHDARRAEYERLAGEAKDLPGARAHAQVLIGESFLVEAKGSGSAKDLRTKARAAFQKAVDDAQAPRLELAAAYAGLGESLFLLGADTDDKALLQDAALAFLRVTSLYREDGRYVAKALFYAMRSFDLMQDPRKKADMKRELLAQFPATSWADEAKK